MKQKTNKKTSFVLTCHVFIAAKSHLIKTGIQKTKLLTQVHSRQLVSYIGTEVSYNAPLPKNNEIKSII